MFSMKVITSCTAAEVIAQDAANLNSIQRGCRSASFGGGNLCDQEIGVRHFRQVLDSLIFPATGRLS
jgi:hypothetical protein